jgi:phenylpropionate dioxygenase-like ring-hydroxylating dioxygenase large terminal subunit
MVIREAAVTAGAGPAGAIEVEESVETGASDDPQCLVRRRLLRRVAGDVLECACHGLAFDQGGRCVAIPALHERSDRIPATTGQQTFPLVEQDEAVWLWPGDPDHAAAVQPPSTPEIASPEWEPTTPRPCRSKPMRVC